MRGVIVCIVAVVLGGFALVEPAESATYYTDKAGSNANSCATAATAASDRTLAKLTISAGEGCLTTAGDTLIVGDGTYVEGVINMNASGTAGNPITIRAENKWLAIISSTSGNNANIEVFSSYVTIDGLKFTLNASNPFPNPPDSSLANDCIRMWNSNNPTGPGNPSSGVVGGRVTDIYCDNPLIPSTSVRARSVGIKTSQDEMIIENSTFDSGVEVINSRNIIVRGNLISGSGYFGTPFVAKGGTRDLQFYNNLLKSPGPGGQTFNNRGITLGGSTGGTAWFQDIAGVECYNCVAYNNVGFFPSGVSSFDFLRCSNCGFYNNVIFGGLIESTNPTQNPTIKNNIFNCDGQGTSPLGTMSYTGTRTIDYNDFYGCSAPPSQTHAVNSDPQFVNPATDWTPQAGSPVLEAGTTIAHTKYSGGTVDMSLDYVGITRTEPWDLGIYEDDSGDTTPPAPPTGITIVRR